MNNSRKIEISKSTLISLKAELLRKRDEVNKAKVDPKNQIENFTPVSKFREPEEEQKVGKSEAKVLRDPEEAEALRKSKESLEKKAQLYDHLSQGTERSENEELFLVNFQKKSSENEAEKANTEIENSPAKDSDDNVNDNADSGDEWADYVDCLGRTRRCLKTDLDYIKNQDENLREKLNMSSAKPSEISQKTFVKEGEAKEVPSDPYKEMMHKKWEEKEQELLKKQSVYYQDVLFDEARTHGVGYYALSGDDEIRAKQQEELKRVHEETEQAKIAAAEARAKREFALQQRVRAAKARQRARAGLPPEEHEEITPSVTAMLLDFVEEQKKVSAEKARKEREAKEIEAQKERSKFVREWDVGKEEFLEDKRRVLTQSEFVDKMRKKRLDEFAPPQSAYKYKTRGKDSFGEKGSYIDTMDDFAPSQPTWEDVRPGRTDDVLNLPGTSQNRSLYFTTKKRKEEIKNKYFDSTVNAGETFEPVPIQDECDVVPMEPVSTKEMKGAEIEPPSTFEYYGPADKIRKKEDVKKVNVAEGFEKGLERLEKHAMEKEKRKNMAIIDDF